MRLTFPTIEVAAATWDKLVAGEPVRVARDTSYQTGPSGYLVENVRAIRYETMDPPTLQVDADLGARVWLP